MSTASAASGPVTSFSMRRRRRVVHRSTFGHAITEIALVMPGEPPACRRWIDRDVASGRYRIATARR